ncbi:hypothetical protein F2Q70_00032420 [Brassica cretica]|uniref:Uncharacterized protein n=1 Tax=Brassica cretica TaxID=69181 RepID=A0A8S9FPL9_BRACR|nr:hypothetical protein F2Q70_00032420 [Brassica cretica]
MYENMWDLTPDTDMLKELPENYSFETALADLIDNSLQAVWSCSPGNRRLISVDVLEDRISVFDSGPGMDSSKENSIARWCIRVYAFGKAYFGVVEDETVQESIHLQLNKEALIDNRSTSGKNWKVDGGMRDSLDEETKLSPHGSFTKVEIFEWKCKIPEIYQLQCRLKDIYFPYIQVEIFEWKCKIPEIYQLQCRLKDIYFPYIQVHGEDLTEIVGGEVATTNLNSKGEEFWFQIQFCEKRKGTSQEANARLKFVYFPVVHGKESTDIIMESFEKEGYKVSESFQTFGRVSVRRLGRLLPEVPWASIPFMERGAKASTLQKCCQRVKCFVDLDAGFVPTPSKVDGGMRDPLEEEMKLSPHGSFTKVEIFEWNCKIPEIYQLQCRLKDIYFPYIQYDEISETGRTLRPVEFQVHGEDLTEIVGGEVATTNLNSKGEAFWFQIRLKGTSQEANARLKFVYFPIVHGKESIDIIMESLEKEGYKVSESFQTFGRVSVRRLGRLLPEVPWTDLASQNLFSVALKNFGSKSKEKDNGVSMVIHREGKSLNYGQVEQSYHDWVLKMHKSYDEEDAIGEDEATVIFDSLDKKALCISHDCEAVRAHKVMKRKGKSWERGRKIKIMKGACGGVHKNDVYATIDYFLIENFEDETGGDARIICRQINFCEEEGCMLSTIKGISKLEIRKSSSFPISIIDTEKCVLIDDNEWNRKLVKQKEKDPSRIDLLDEKDCRTLKFNGETTIGASVCAGQTLPQQIVAVVRPASYTSSKLSKKLDQKHFVKMDREMLMEVELQGTQMKSREKNAKPLVGSSLPPLSIYCLDEYENQIPFTSVPSLEVRLKASPEFEVPVYMIEANLTDSGILKLKNMVVETDALDDIRPDYEATLEICSKDEPFSVSVACIGNVLIYNIT